MQLILLNQDNSSQLGHDHVACVLGDHKIEHSKRNERHNKMTYHSRLWMTYNVTFKENKPNFNIIRSRKLKAY